MEEKMYRPLENLTPWEENPRSITAGNLTRLKNQIIKHGQYKPILVTKDGIVIGGNMRLKAYKELGIKNIWISVIDFTEESGKWYATVNGEKQFPRLPKPQSRHDGIRPQR